MLGVKGGTRAPKHPPWLRHWVDQSYDHELMRSVCCSITADVTDVRVPQCGRLEWDISTITPEACGEGLTYRVRFYSGTTYQSTSTSQKKVIITDTNSVDFTAEDVPATRPLKAMVSNNLGL